MHDVSLVSLTTAHAQATYRWLCSPDIQRDIGLRNRPSLEKSIAYANRTMCDSTISAYAILLDNVHVGNAILDLIDSYIKKARLHIYIGEPSARGKGIGKKSVRILLSIAFLELELNKIWLTVHPSNVRAIHTYVSIGFILEGIHRDEFLLNGEFVSEIYMGILKKEFSNYV